MLEMEYFAFVLASGVTAVQQGLYSLKSRNGTLVPFSLLPSN